ncbi:hypothetical protein CWB96_22965, partial [Pseudoalteromonas citrea]
MMPISHGSFQRKITTSKTAQLNTIKIDINNSGENLNQVIEELRSVMAALCQGNFSMKIELSLQGQLQQLKEDGQGAIAIISRAISELN